MTERHDVTLTLTHRHRKNVSRTAKCSRCSENISAFNRKHVRIAFSYVACFFFELTNIARYEWVKARKCMFSNGSSTTFIIGNRIRVYTVLRWSCGVVYVGRTSIKRQRSHGTRACHTVFDVRPQNIVVVAPVRIILINGKRRQISNFRRRRTS